MYSQSDSYDRLIKILKKDKINMPQMIEDSLKKDILKVVSSYLNIKAVNSILKVEVANSGEILVTFEGVADSFKQQGKWIYLYVFVILLSYRYFCKNHSTFSNCQN